MAEPRKIVLILGNGFDLDLGLKTSYKDFWESEYCPKNYPAPLIRHLNQCWPGNLESVRWYDLENELLNYYNTIQNPKQVEDYITEEEKDFLKVFEPYKASFGVYKEKEGIIDSLIDKGVVLNNNTIQPLSCPYQNEVFQSPEWRDQKAHRLIKEGLCEYLKSISRPVNESSTLAHHLLLAMTKSAEAGADVSIYSFNYTPVLMRGQALEGINVHYMHGSCADNNIIVGTRDDIDMVPSYDFLQKSMDDNYLPPDLVTALKNADEVIVFGHSLGENDRQYFAPFFLQQSNVDNVQRKDITLFTYDNDSKRDVKRAMNRMTNGNLSALYSINQPTIIRSAYLDEDQNLLYDFFVKHHTDGHYAEKVIGALIKQKESKESVAFEEFTAFDPRREGVNSIPEEPGNYVVLVRDMYSFPTIGYSLHCETFNQMSVIYVGSAKDSIRECIVNKHFSSNSELSTLRQSLGCLFRLKTHKQDSSSTRDKEGFFSIQDEAWLFNWMKEYLVFYYFPNDNPAELESELIKRLNPPLNIKNNRNKENSDFRSALKDLMNQ